MKEIINNKVTLNPVELCSELAIRELYQSYRNHHSLLHLSDEEVEDRITEEDKNGEFHYTEEAQDIFNKIYDEYWTITEKLAI